VQGSLSDTGRVQGYALNCRVCPAIDTFPKHTSPALAPKLARGSSLSGPGTGSCLKPPVSSVTPATACDIVPVPEVGLRRIDYFFLQTLAPLGP
jgi:hypothetical protein